MARLEVIDLSLPCTAHGYKYFPSGVREGLLLKIAGGDQLYGIGECSLLLGVHHHSLDDARELLASNKINSRIDDLLSLDAKSSLSELVDFFDRIPAPLSYALSMAHLHRGLLTARPQILANDSVKLSALIPPSSTDEAVMIAKEHISRGYTCLKVKIKRLSVKEEIKKIVAINDLAQGQLSFRLDANRALDLRQVSELLAGLSKISIEYFEEPALDLKKAELIARDFGVDVAIDESLPDLNQLQRSIEHGIKFVVIKPSRFKSVYWAIDLAMRVKSHGGVAIFSHCFDSEFSSAISVWLVHKLGIQDRYHGLVAEGCFISGILSVPLRRCGDRIFLRDAYTSLSSDLIGAHSLKRCDRYVDA